PVTKLDVSIPGSPSPANPAAEAEPATATPTASNAQGKALIAKIVASLGGEAKLQSVKSLRVKYKQVAETAEGQIPAKMETTIVFPDRVRADIESQRGNVQLVVTPD